MKRGTASLVSYSSSDEDAAEPSEPLPKKRKLPVLASSLVPIIPVDNPALHQGRVRTQPHVEGQFSAFVYVSIDVDQGSPLRQLLSDAMRYAKTMLGCLQELSEVPLGLKSDPSNSAKCSLHISLSRPIYLRAYQRDDLKRTVKTLANRSSPFTGSFATFSELTNDEKTRTFLALEVGAGHHELESLCEGLTPTLKALRQKEFYSDPRFHASFAWALLDSPFRRSNPPAPSSSSFDIHHLDASIPVSNDQFPTIRHLPPELVPALQAAYMAKLASPDVNTFTVDKIHVKIGKEVSSWRLAGTENP